MVYSQNPCSVLFLTFAISKEYIGQLSLLIFCLLAFWQFMHFMSSDWQLLNLWLPPYFSQLFVLLSFITIMTKTLIFIALVNMISISYSIPAEASIQVIISIYYGFPYIRSTLEYAMWHAFLCFYLATSWKFSLLSIYFVSRCFKAKYCQ